MSGKSKLGVIIEKIMLNRKPIELVYSHIRYEYLRKLNARQFANLYDECLHKELNFDDEVLRRAINEY